MCMFNMYFEKIFKYDLQKQNVYETAVPHSFKYPTLLSILKCIYYLITKKPTDLTSNLVLDEYLLHICSDCCWGRGISPIRTSHKGLAMTLSRTDGSGWQEPGDWGCQIGHPTSSLTWMPECSPLWGKNLQLKRTMKDIWDLSIVLISHLPDVNFLLRYTMHK